MTDKLKSCEVTAAVDENAKALASLFESIEVNGVKEKVNRHYLRPTSALLAEIAQKIPGGR